MTEENNNVLADASAVLEMDENVAHVTAAVLGETKLPPTEAKAIQWVNLPTAADLRMHIFNAPDIKEELVQVEEWQCEILVRGMNGDERADVMQPSLLNGGTTANLKVMYPMMCIMGCFHPVTKERIWTVADRDMLNKKAGGVLEKLAMTVARLSGLDQNQAEIIRKN